MSAFTKKPVLLRILFCAITILLFAFAMYPLQEQDFMTTLNSKILSDKASDPKLKTVLTETEAYAKQKDMFESTALPLIADKYNLNLADYLRPSSETRTTKDAVALIKRDCASSIRLGIDLSGGVEYLIELMDIVSEDSSLAADKMSFSKKADRARELLRTRLENTGIYESEISIQGGKFISLRAPIRSKEEKMTLERLITQAAKLRFRLVATNSQEEVVKYRAALDQNNPDAYTAPFGYEMMKCVSINAKTHLPETEFYLVERKAEMTGIDVRNAQVARDQYGQVKIHLQFNSRGAADFARVTTANVGRQLAIVLDGTLYSAPVLRTAIYGGNAEISGSFTMEEGETVANALSSGNLPFNMVVQGVYDVDSTLGAANVKSGILASVLSLLAVMLFMFIYYPKTGWAANIALFANIVLILGALAAFNQTLTLPGIAGVILTIGMAVDANILINERIREELRDGKSVFHAIQNGYDRAFLTIFDSNVTTLLMGIILVWFSTGAVKGFAIVLSIGIVTSMFTALMLTRVLFDFLGRFDRPKNIPCFSLMGLGETRMFDFLSVRRYAFIISIALVLLSFGVFAVKSTSAFSIDFVGGTQLAYTYTERVPEDQLSKVMTANNINNAKITYKATGTQKLVEIIVPEESTKGFTEIPVTIGNMLEKAHPGFLVKSIEEDAGSVYKVDAKEIGGLVGQSFAETAFLSIALACIGILLYVTLRFEMVYAFSATIALFHDVIIAAGFFLLLGGQISLGVVAALLTLYGYSINNTIVIFDRIREQHRLYPERHFAETINNSINQTLSRSILTSFTVLITALILLIGGGIAIYDFALVMLIGLIVGGYSSVFLASPIVYWWYNRFGIKYDEESAVLKMPEVEKKKI